jgi:hypothetical protein
MGHTLRTLTGTNGESRTVSISRRGELHPVMMG